MANKVNTKGVSAAKKLIAAGDIDFDSSWEFTAADGNKLLGAEGKDWDNYSKFHLAINTEAEPETKAYYKYPYGKNGKIYRRGVIAGKSRAAQQGEDDISAAADSLLQAIDAKREKKKDEYEIDKADQFRIDFVEITPERGIDDYMVEKFEKTPDGFLRGRSIITNVGVFSYMQPDGSIQREVRLPEEVFRTDTIEGFRMLPLTNGHPAEPVNIENVKQLQVGYLGDELRMNSFYLSAPIMITDAEAVAEAQAGKRGLSAGYKCDLERKSGTWLGMQYDAVQRNIRPNHVALVDRGRAGDDARIKMDSMGAYGVQIIDQNLIKGEVSMPTLKKIRLDNGVEYEAEDKVIEAYTSAQKKVDELGVKVKTFTEQEETWKKDKSALEAERDQFKEESEKLKKDLAEAEKLDSQKLNEALEKKMILLDAARRADVDVTHKEDEALKREIILKMFPSAKDKLDKAEEAYVNARFDAALEYLEQFEKERGKTDKFLAGDSIRHSDQADSPQKSREKMIERQLNAWKKDKSEEEK